MSACVVCAQVCTVDVSEPAKKPSSPVKFARGASERHTTVKVRVNDWVHKLLLSRINLDEYVIIVCVFMCVR